MRNLAVTAIAEKLHLSTRDLIARMTPTALAEMIASIEQAGNLDDAESFTVYLLRTSLAVNVGDAEAGELIAAAQGYVACEISE